jgi:serine/threonine protein kinase
MVDLTGRTISHYEILNPLGAGGMGAVYRARDLKLDRIVALKFLPPDLSRDPQGKQRFLNEARITSSLQHRNICVVYDVDETEEGQLFISMECLPGVTLKQHLETGPLAYPDAVNISGQVADGLSCAHSLGIVHRDLKPANIMIGPDGTVKILDFGLAKAHDTSLVTAAGGVLGTVAYMSPEQARGETVDARTDLWSLGVILYEMVTGVRPARSDYPQAIIYAIINERHAPPRTFRPDLPVSIEAVINRCLEKSPAARFPNVASFLEDLRHAGSESPAPRDAGVKAIAVLPFSDIGPDKENTYFSDGLTEEIITKLSRLDTVKILSKSSVMQYDRAGKSTRQIAAELGVQYLLEGSVRQHGSALRITTQLVDANEDAYLWAETYNGTMDEIFDIQEDVAGRVVKALKVRLSPADKRTLKRRATRDTGAYQLYLKGRYFWSKRTRESFLTAITYFEEAIAKDPKCAPAWAGIADCYLLLNDFADTPRKETYAKAEAAVRKALAIDDKLAEAHTSLGLLAMLVGWKWAQAEKEFKLAIEASPNYATAHHWYGEWLVCEGRVQEALAEISLAVELDPLSPAAIKDKGLIQYYGRFYDESIVSARKAIELNSNFPFAHRLLSLAYQAKGMFDEAMAEHERWASYGDMGFEETAARAQCYAAAGMRGEAIDLLHRCPPRESAEGNLARGVALAYIALGNHDLAFSWLERAYETGAEALGTLRVDPKLDPIRSDPRFSSLLTRVGFRHESRG